MLQYTAFASSGALQVVLTLSRDKTWRPESSVSSLLQNINILNREDFLEVKLNIKFVILKDCFNALFVVKLPVKRKI